MLHCVAFIVTFSVFSCDYVICCFICCCCRCCSSLACCVHVVVIIYCTQKIFIAAEVAITPEPILPAEPIQPDKPVIVKDGSEKADPVKKGKQKAKKGTAVTKPVATTKAPAKAQAKESETVAVPPINSGPSQSPVKDKPIDNETTLDVKSKKSGEAKAKSQPAAKQAEVHGRKGAKKAIKPANTASEAVKPIASESSAKSEIAVKSDTSVKEPKDSPSLASSTDSATLDSTSKPAKAVGVKDPKQPAANSKSIVGKKTVKFPAEIKQKGKLAAETSVKENAPDETDLKDKSAVEADKKDPSTTGTNKGKPALEVENKSKATKGGNLATKTEKKDKPKTAAGSNKQSVGADKKDKLDADSPQVDKDDKLAKATESSKPIEAVKDIVLVPPLSDNITPGAKKKRLKKKKAKPTANKLDEEIPKSPTNLAETEKSDNTVPETEKVLEKELSVLSKKSSIKPKSGGIKPSTSKAIVEAEALPREDTVLSIVAKDDPIDQVLKANTVSSDTLDPPKPDQIDESNRPAFQTDKPEDSDSSDDELPAHIQLLASTKPEPKKAAFSIFDVFNLKRHIPIRKGPPPPLTPDLDDTISVDSVPEFSRPGTPLYDRPPTPRK